MSKPRQESYLDPGAVRMLHLFYTIPVVAKTTLLTAVSYILSVTSSSGKVLAP
jgi:hypothetical protein